MKKNVVVFLTFAVFMMSFPLLSLGTKKEISDSPGVIADYISGKNDKSNFKVLISETGKTVTVSADDYVFSVVAAEMPVSYEEEALKAQAVAAYSFAVRRKAYNNSQKKDYDITDDPKTDQCYISPEKARENWGSHSEEYEKKIRNAVESVSEMAAFYGDEVALTLYHAISGGKTENITDVFGGKAEYLVSRDSVWDKLAPDYMSVVKKTAEELKKCFGVDDYKGKTSDLIKITEKTANGTVKKAVIGGKEFSGDEIRKKLSLRSMNFTVKASSDGITFTVYGYGHGVGMSQNGANYLAKQGYTYKQILEHYYKGITLKKCRG